jgi:4-hydroxy-4-methyl-2-oxoglutarate aldolase
MTDLTARLEACYSGAVFDVLRDLGHANCVLPSASRRTMCGR